MAVMAKAINKPFYVVAECFKFMRVFPLNQEDLPNSEKVYESICNVLSYLPTTCLCELVHTYVSV